MGRLHRHPRRPARPLEPHLAHLHFSACLPPSGQIKILRADLHVPLHQRRPILRPHRARRRGTRSCPHHPTLNPPLSLPLSRSPPSYPELGRNLGGMPLLPSPLYSGERVRVRGPPVIRKAFASPAPPPASTSWAASPTTPAL